MKKSIRILSVFLTALMIFGVITCAPFSVEAAEEEQPVAASGEQSAGASSGTTGDCSWTLDNNGVLTISGNGQMGDYNFYRDAYVYPPWYDQENENADQVTKIVIESGVTKIGNYAFYDCRKASEVTIPNTVTTIGKWAFSSCKSLTNITIPDSVESIGELAFFACSGITSFTVPDSVKTIDRGAFCYCGSLKKIRLPEGLTEISNELFENSGKLSEITIPDSVTKIGNSAFWGCHSLESIIIPDKVTKIGYVAFYDCTGLKSITIPGSVTDIDYEAFEAWFPDAEGDDPVMKFVIYCEPESYAEEYAKELEYPYKYLFTVNSGTVKVSVDAVFGNCIVKLGYSGGSTVSRYVKNGAALFSGVDVDKKYSVSLYNNDRLIERCDNVTLTDNEASVSFDGKDLCSASVHVQDEDGNPLDDCSIEWFVNNALTADSKTDSVSYLKKGDSVICRVKIGDSLKKTYENPVDVTRVISAENESFTVTVKKAPSKNVTVKVRDEDGNAVPSASVSVVQHIDSRENPAESFTADNNGELKLTLRTVDTTIKASETRYFATSFSGVPDGSDIVLTLKSSSGAQFIPNVNYQYCEDTVHTESDKTSLDDLTFSVYNVTQSKEISSFSYSNNCITIPLDSLNSGDKIEFSATDASGVFAEAKATAEYKGDTLKFDITLVERGRAAFGYTSENKETLALIFDSAKKRVSTAELDKSNVSSPLVAGSYTAVIIGNAEILSQVPDYDSLLSYGLRENTDFVKREFTISDNQVTNISGIKVPVFNEDSILYTDSGKTYMSASPNTVNLGKYSKVSVRYEIAEKYKNAVRPEAVEIIMPSSAKLSPGIMVNGVTTNDSTVNGNTISVPVVDDEAKVTLAVIPQLYVSDQLIYANLVLNKDGKIIRQPIGSDSLTMKEDFFIPEQISKPEFWIGGNVKPKSSVDVYVDGVHKSTVTASQMGYFKTKVSVDKTYNHSFHTMYFDVTDTEQVTYRSKSYIVEYDSDAVIVETIKMSPNGHMSDSVTLYSLYGDSTTTYYYWFGTLDQLTYTVEFSGDVSKLTKTILLSKTNDGKTIEIPLTRIGNTESYTGTYTYHFNFPDALYVSYDYESENKFDLQAQKASEQEYADQQQDADDALAELKSEIEKLSEADKSNFLSELKKVFSDDLTNPISNYESKDGVTSFDDPTNKLRFFTREWTDASATSADLISKGYEKVKTYNANDELYVLETGEHRTIADLSTGVFRTVSITDIPTKSVHGPDPVGWYPENDTLTDMLGSSVQQTYTILSQYCAKLGQTKSQILVFGATHPQLAQACFAAAQFLGVVLSVIQLVKWEKDTEFWVTHNTLRNYLTNEYTALKKEVERKHCAEEELRRFKAALDDYSGKVSALGACLVGNMGLIIAQIYSICKAGFTAATASNLVIAWEIVSFIAGLVLSCTIDFLKKDIPKLNKTATKRSNELKEALSKCDGGHGPDNPPGPGGQLNKIGDPSGYVYEAVTDNRLTGVTVTAFYSENADGKDAQVWESEDYDQRNPLVTDSMGHYEWFVPDGYWQVKCEKEGYEIAYSDWLPVPPPQMDVNIAMTSLSAPTLAFVNAYSDAVELEFSQYMNPYSVNKNAVQVTMNGNTISGTIKPETSENAPDGTPLAKRFIFTPDSGTKLSGNVVVSVKAAQNYAGSAMDGETSKTVPVGQRITSFKTDETLTVTYGSPVNAALTFAPAAAAAGKTVRLKIDNNALLSSESDTAVVGSDGVAKFKLSALLPGSATVTYTVDGTSLKAQTKVTCAMESDMEQLPRVTASVESGKTVKKGTKLALSCAVPNAKIYYTLDLSCPCQADNPERVLYTEPIEITDGMQLIAYAVLDGYKESKTTLFTYNVADYLVGDVNNDGQVNGADAGLLSRYAAGWKDYDKKIKSMAAADINGDGAVNGADAGILARHTSGWKQYAKYFDAA